MKSPQSFYRGLETWFPYKRSPSDLSDSSSAVDWPARVRGRCVALAHEGAMEGGVAYEMWRRTSSGRPQGFDRFLCHGQTIFSDCDLLQWPSEPPEDFWRRQGATEEEPRGLQEELDRMAAEMEEEGATSSSGTTKSSFWF